ncbi:MAG TPA: hypothetical protein VFP62_09280 [Burkholderiales bacterium]|nr:hypothetical protein [Burkholderiales bacterium]
MRAYMLLLLLACAPAQAADNAAERTAKSAGDLLDRAAKSIERGAKRTGKAAERPRGATQRFVERSGKKIDNATGGR